MNHYIDLSFILGYDIKDVEDYEEPEVYYDLLKDDKVTRYLLERGAKRGDVVIINEICGYRNDGVAFWDGSKVIPMDHELDDYGTVPPTFTVGEEFNTTHWQGTIAHNSYVWIDPKFKTELIDNADDTGSHFMSAFGRVNVRTCYANGFRKGAKESFKAFIASCTGPVPLELAGSHYDDDDETSLVFFHTKEKYLQSLGYTVKGYHRFSGFLCTTANGEECIIEATDPLFY